MKQAVLQRFLEQKMRQYGTPDFIPGDPVCIPHRYSRLQDIEIAGFFAALFAWGRRSLIIKKASDLLALMDHAPYAFIREHQPQDLKRFLGFVHRTFNTTDILYFIAFLQQYYQQHASLETAFCAGIAPADPTVENGLNAFYHRIFPGDHPARTTKHISAPARKSACKRINMFLRWMVRPDTEGVDFGLWRRIHPAQLIIPMDTHVCRVAARLNLLAPGPANWKRACALTTALKAFRPEDPVRYDFALFGLGVIEHFN